MAAEGRDRPDPTAGTGACRGTGHTLPPFLYAGFADILRNPEKKLARGEISAVPGGHRCFRPVIELV